MLHFPALTVEIRLIGIWDSVGAVGAIWRDQNVLGYEDDHCPKEDCVEEAVHALALHENRDRYAPNLWNVSEDDHKRVAQVRSSHHHEAVVLTISHKVWFPGAHSQVGGGSASRVLSDNALHWITVSFHSILVPNKVGGLYTNYQTRSLAFKINWKLTKPHGSALGTNCTNPWPGKSRTPLLFLRIVIAVKAFSLSFLSIGKYV